MPRAGLDVRIDIEFSVPIGLYGLYSGMFNSGYSKCVVFITQQKI